MSSSSSFSGRIMVPIADKPGMFEMKDVSYAEEKSEISLDSASLVTTRSYSYNPPIPEKSFADYLLPPVQYNINLLCDYLRSKMNHESTPESEAEVYEEMLDLPGMENYKFFLNVTFQAWKDNSVWAIHHPEDLLGSGMKIIKSKVESVDQVPKLENVPVGELNAENLRQIRVYKPAMITDVRAILRQAELVIKRIKEDDELMGETGTFNIYIWAERGEEKPVITSQWCEFKHIVPKSGALRSPEPVAVSTLINPIGEFQNLQIGSRRKDRKFLDEVISNERYQSYQNHS